jgi:putative flippase GtrA
MEASKGLWALIPPSRQRAARYLVAGGTATASNFATLYVLTEFAHVWYLASSIAALTVGFVVSFILQKFWTFQNKGLARVHVQLPLHILLSLANVGANTVMLYGMVEYLHIWYLAAQFINAAILATCNFFVYRRFIFP